MLSQKSELVKLGFFNHFQHQISPDIQFNSKGLRNWFREVRAIYAQVTGKVFLNKIINQSRTKKKPSFYRQHLYSLTCLRKSDLSRIVFFQIDYASRWKSEPTSPSKQRIRRQSSLTDASGGRRNVGKPEQRIQVETQYSRFLHNYKLIGSHLMDKEENLTTFT